MKGEFYEQHTYINIIDYSTVAFLQMQPLFFQIIVSIFFIFYADGVEIKIVLLLILIL